MSRVPALLVMHGDLSTALLRAAEEVAGGIDGVETLSNAGLSRDALEAEIARRVALWDEGGLVLTDFWGGSCHTCGLSVSRGRGRIAVLTGLNLPMLIDYAYNRDRCSVVELAERLQKKGQDSIRLQLGEPA